MEEGRRLLGFCGVASFLGFIMKTFIERGVKFWREKRGERNSGGKLGFDFFVFTFYLIQK